MTEKNKKQRRAKRRPLSEFPQQYVGSFDDEPDGWEFLTSQGVAKRELGGEGKPLPLFSGVMGLGGWVVDRYEEFEDGHLVVYARCQVVPTACDRCSSNKLIRFGSQSQKFRDLPYHMKPTTLVVERQRLRCKDCGKTQFQMLPHMDAQHMMTERLKKYVRKQAMERTFTSIAEDVGVDEKTVRRIFSAYADELERTHRIYTPEWLGIDEVHLTHQMRCVLTDVSAKKPLDILKDRNRPTVEQWLLKYMDPKALKIVTIDMHTAYRNAVATVLPEAKIVVDKFHVERAANKALDTVRKATHKQVTEYQRKQLKHDRKIMLMRNHALNDQQRLILSLWLDNFADLGKAYLLKEAFYDIYNFATKYDAQMAYQRWLEELREQSDLVREAFSEIVTFMANWQEPIFNYFDVRATNAYTESVNGLLKQIYREGRGYSFKAIRAKVLYGKLG